MTWVDFVNFVMAVAGLIVALLAVFIDVSIPYLSRWNRRFYVILFSGVACYTFSNLLSQVSLTILGEGYQVLTGAAIFFESLTSSLLMLLLTLFLLKCAGEGWKRNWWFFGAVLIWGVYFSFLCDTQITGIFYRISEDNVYYRGPYYPLLLVPPVLLMGYNLFALFVRRRRLSPIQWKALLTNMVICVAGMVIQMFFYGYYMIVISTVIGTLCMFILSMREGIDRHVELIKREANQQARIAVLQMRPHFIYNTLTSIYYLCADDPKEAMKAIMDFSVYLRSNFAAIAMDQTIPVKDELEHVRAYLNVEKMRFPDYIFVRYDIACSEFEVPALSVQPLVENSVKHGLDPEEDPLWITIRTARTEEGYEVVVEDTGPGFDEETPPEEEGGNHIALDNIRKRLALMCDGTLFIHRNEEGRGTKAVIRIPRSGRKGDEK